MAYKKTVWKNRLVERPQNYTLRQNADGTVTLLAKEGKIIEEGTPVNAENLNKIENTLAGHDTQIADMSKQLGGKENTLPTERKRKITFGTGDPTPSNMEEGEVYMQYE